MTSSTPPVTEPLENEDVPYGQFMFLVFAAAVVIVASAVGLLSVSSTWWMLAVVFGVHVTATIAVSAVIARALADRTTRAARDRTASSAAAGRLAAPSAAAV